MRRTTLGSLSKSNMNARTSAGLPTRARASLAVSKTAEDRRASAFPSFNRPRSTGGAAPRHSSLSRSSLALSRTVKRTDPRPLSDRSYMQKSAKLLISFVIERGYEHPISPKMLTSPSSKDFQLLFLFLVRRIDPTYAFIKRFEDEVPPLLRALGYPFSISKSALSAVGSPHTWPTLLGVLTWLVNLLKYDEAYAASQNSGTTMDPQSRREGIFYDNTVEAYDQFLRGADTFPQLDAELDAHFNGENQNREAEVEKLSADREQLTATLHTLKTQPSPLRLISEHKESLATNINKFKLLIPSLIEHANAVRKLLTDKQAEIVRVDAHINELSREKTRLSDVLCRQEENEIDVNRIAADRDTLKKALSKASSDMVNAEAERTDAQQLVAIAKAELIETVKSYNKIADALQKQGDNHLKLNVRDSAQDGVLDKDVEHSVIPTLRVGRDEFVARVPKLQEEVHALNERGDEIEERLIVLRHSLGMLEARKSKLESEYQAKKNGMNELLRQRKDTVLQREEHIAMERERLQELMRVQAREVKELQNQLKGYEEMFERYVARVSANTERGVTARSEHQQIVRNTLVRVREYLEEQKADLDEGE
ncbi:Kinetochore protein NDC80-like [Gracilariopsis chorda]|uniref:Kinetochore protein NDC80 n=1 Tax=Gracilariopsis chorda TaxID=448386 RepID=A0A2V3IU12_9FLOR|nr:Kinetochore protein NDC80-like [Gracilariopsis chorda]|eukprot:PXF45593.1 Kinetochore protein NDC80-like [Gracilariopsis chorda]